MHRSARLKLLLLALMVAASHVALLAHATAHFVPALEQCELCVSQAQPMAAIPAVDGPVAMHCPAPPALERPAAPLPLPAPRHYHPRGPPARSS